MNNRFSLRFYFKKPKGYTKSDLPIYMRISIGCERTEISTQRKWNPDRWRLDAGRAIGTKEDARALNAHLDTLQMKVFEAQRRLIANHEDITIDNLRLLLEGRRTRSKMLIDVFKDHNKKLEQLINKDFAEGALELKSLRRCTNQRTKTSW